MNHDVMAGLKTAIYFIGLLGLFLGFASPVFAQKTLVITSLEEPIEIRPYLEIIPDPDWQYNSEEILSGELDHLWQPAPLEGALIDTNSSLQRLWFRVRVDNRSGESAITWHEAFPNATVYSYALASNPSDGLWSFSHNWSEMIAFNPDLPETFPSARLNPTGWLTYSYPTKMAQNENVFVGLAHSFPGLPIISNWQLQSPTATQSALLQHTLLNVITITAIIVLSLYYLFVFIRLRLLPCLWISGLGVVNSISLVLLDKSVWLLDVCLSPIYIWHITHIALFFAGVIYLGFIASALDFPKRFKLFRHGFKFWTLINALNYAYYILTFSPFGYIIGEKAVFISLFIAWGLLYAAVALRIEGARLLIIGSLAAQVGSGLYFLPLFGLIEPSTLTEWAFHLGLVTEAICFVLFLSHHTQQYQHKANIYENLFQSLYDSAQEGRFSWTLDSGELQHNPALSRCLGYTDDTISLQQLDHQLALAETIPARALMQKNGFSLTQELQLIPNSLCKEHRWISLSLNYRPANPFFKEAIEGVVQDITDRKQRELSEQSNAIMLFSKLEAEQRANEAMRAAAKAKNEFLSTMSHELRTPLTSIIGFTELLRERGKLNQSKVPFLDSVVSESQHLLTIVDDILQISLINEGKLILREKNLYLRDFLNNLEAEYLDTAAQSDLHLQFTLDPCLPEQLQLDGEKCQQIIHQILDNAIKFTPTGEVLLALTKTNNEHELQVTITDTGIGMDKHTQVNCFHAFTQGDSSHQRAFGGTGVGLYIAHALATKMGGSLSVHSTPNEGSCFTLRLPYKTLDNTETPIQTNKIDNDKPLEGQVLYVEDNPTLQMLVRLLVKRTGAEIECVANGQEALNIIEQHPQRFDLILMDLQMPVLNGIEATERLRKKGCTTPVVAFSASALEEIQPSSLEMFDGYLGKPVDKTKLKEILIRYLEEKNSNTPSAASYGSTHQ